jgi:hypothetical protein
MQIPRGLRLAPRGTFAYYLNQHRPNLLSTKDDAGA